MRGDEQIHRAYGVDFRLKRCPNPSVSFGCLSVKRCNVKGRNKLPEGLSILLGLSASGSAVFQFRQSDSGNPDLPHLEEANAAPTEDAV